MDWHGVVTVRDRDNASQVLGPRGARSWGAVELRTVPQRESYSRGYLIIALYKCVFSTRASHKSVKQCLAACFRARVCIRVRGLHPCFLFMTRESCPKVQMVMFLFWGGLWGKPVVFVFFFSRLIGASTGV